MRTKLISAAVAAAGALAFAAGNAMAVTAVSPGQLVGRPNEFDGQTVSVTGWVQFRGGGWAQLCDNGTACIYLRRSDDYHGRPLSELENQRLTFSGVFHASGVINSTNVVDVLDVQG